MQTRGAFVRPELMTASFYQDFFLLQPISSLESVDERTRIADNASETNEVQT